MVGKIFEVKLHNSVEHVVYFCLFYYSEPNQIFHCVLFFSLCTVITGVFIYYRYVLPFYTAGFYHTVIFLVNEVLYYIYFYCIHVFTFKEKCCVDL